MKKANVCLIAAILFFTLANAGTVLALGFPGILDGSGTHFEITDSMYLNITLDSSEPIKIMLESAPEMVTMHIEPISETPSTIITVSGFVPLTTYYKYEDDYHNLVEFTTDESGDYIYTQDLSKGHLIFIQSTPSTIYLSNTGWDDGYGNDPGVGTWNPITLTGTLTTDVTETIQIDSDGITIDGDGHTVTSTGNGIYLPYRTGVTIKNLELNSTIIRLYYSNNNILTSNTVSDSYTGIWLSDSNNNILTNNTVSNVESPYYGYAGFGLQKSGNNELTNNTISEKYVGILLGWTSNNNTVTGNIFNLNYPVGLAIDGGSSDTLVQNNSFLNNHQGINLYHTTGNNTIVENNISGSEHGIWLQNVSSYTIRGNNFSDNTYGTYLYHYSNSNTIINNNFSNNNYGIYLSKGANENLIVENNISNNSYGIYLSQGYSGILGPNDNNIVNNNFIENATQAFVYVGTYSGTNNIFNLDKPTGGNYWNDWTSPDADNDGFVDEPYVFTGDQDNLPHVNPIETSGEEDTTPPITTISLSGTAGDNEWYVSDVEVTLAATDEGGTVALTEYSLDEANWSTYSAPFEISEEDTSTVYFRSTDDSGNVEGTKSETIKVDKTAPTITFTQTPEPNENGWNNTDVTIQFQCNDETSGIDSCTPDTTITTEGTAQTITGTATDQAGNTASTTTEINIDKTPPSIAIITPVADGSYAVGMDLDFSANDLLSGALQPIGELTDSSGETQQVESGFKPEPGVYTLVVEATDQAGNTAVSDTVNFVVYDPKRGFAIGVGWFHPDEESSLPSEGRAIFGFVARYKKDGFAGRLRFHFKEADIKPKSKTFHFKDDDIKLKSKTIDWLVISGTNTEFQGTGTINGKGLYTFRIKAEDNGKPRARTDYFDIRIWEGTDTEADPIYSAKNTLKAGNIVIPKKSDKK